MKNHLTDNLIAQLNGIYHISAMGNETRAREQIKILAETLRYKIRNRNELVSLRTEKEKVAGIFSLFDARWGDEFTASLDTPEELLGEYIPHYSIMGLVENSLFHAFEKQEGGRMVKVSVRRGAGGLDITVEDNGCGYNPPRGNGTVPETEPSPEGNTAHDCGGLGGLASLGSRLVSLYGDGAELSFHSVSPSGTRAELFIPVTEPTTGRL